MAEKSTGFVLWTIYLVLCGFGYAGYVFYLAATGAYEIVELEKIEMTRQLDKVYRLDHAVTKTQKVILSAFDMDWNYVKYRACSCFSMSFFLSTVGIRFSLYKTEDLLIAFFASCNSF